MLNFFNLDLHISVIADVKDLLGNRVKITDWSLSGHTWVMKKATDNIKVITQSSWLNIDMGLVEKFHSEYDSFLKLFDGFIVGHPNVFVLLYEKYNKPIIMVNSCRYDMPACFTKNTAIVSQINSCILRLQTKGLLTIISNNLADKAYLELAVPGVKSVHIPSLCRYIQLKHTPTYSQFLLYSGEKCVDNHILIKKRAELGRFDWSELGKYQGIIHIPYEASTMSIFEHITAGIPLFFPTKRFLKELWETKQTHFQCNYWGNTPDYLEPTKSYDFWLDRADYYDVKGYYYFDSFNELFKILENFKDEKREERFNFLENRTSHIIDFWNKIKLPDNIVTSTNSIQMKNFLFKLGL